MCGLLLSIQLASGTGVPTDHPIKLDLDAIAARGPDSLHTYHHHVTLQTGHVLHIQLVASVLGLRGEGITAQPVEGERGVLGWNGQVFQGIPLGPTENDTAKVSEKLEKGEDLLNILASIEGP